MEPTLEVLPELDLSRWDRSRLQHSRGVLDVMMIIMNDESIVCSSHPHFLSSPVDQP